MDFQNDGQDTGTAISSYSRPEWADTSFAGGPRPPVPPPFDPRKPRMGRHRSRRLFDIVALYRPVKPSDSRKFRSPINNQGVQITNQNEDLRSSAKSAVKNLSFSCLSVSKPRMTPIPADSNSYNLSELNTIQGGVASPYSQSATLDTKPLAKSYLGGSRSHWSSTHFQYARAWLCSSFFIHLGSHEIVLPV